MQIGIGKMSCDSGLSGPCHRDLMLMLEGSGMDRDDDQPPE